MDVPFSFFGAVNRILLAEEIQHGLDRATSAASNAINQGLTNRQFHAQVFGRILQREAAGGYEFLTVEDLAAIRKLAQELRR